MKDSARVLALCLLPFAAGFAQANDFPTLDRVLYVHECMRENPGGHYEMVSKCSCALDALATEVSHEEYMAMKTATDARSIGGERGGYIRANEAQQKAARRYAEIQQRVQRGCFIGPGTR